MPAAATLQNTIMLCSQQMYPFETVDAFYTLMNRLIATSTPALSRAWLAQGGEVNRKEERL